MSYGGRSRAGSTDDNLNPNLPLAGPLSASSRPSSAASRASVGSRHSAALPRRSPPAPGALGSAGNNAGAAAALSPPGAGAGVGAGPITLPTLVATGSTEGESVLQPQPIRASLVARRLSSSSRLWLRAPSEA